MKQFTHNAAEKVTDADQALNYLKKGNERYVNGEFINRQSSADEWQVMQEGQHPFAAVLSCSDSRVSPSVIFDQKNGDLFTVRNAGNTADSVALGSLEYAVKYLQVPLIVICGHSSCGAVNAVFNKTEGLPKHLSDSLEIIKDSVEAEKDISAAEKNHAEKMADTVKANDVVKSAGTTVVTAYYNLENGTVHWL